MNDQKSSTKTKRTESTADRLTDEERHTYHRAAGHPAAHLVEDRAQLGRHVT